MAKNSAILEVFEDANPGRLEFLNARTLAYSIPGELNELRKLVETWQAEKGDDRTRLFCGVGLWILRRYEEACDMLSGLSKQADGAYFLGLCQKELGRYDDAVKSFSAAAAAGQDAFICGMAIADSWRLDGKRDKALEEVRKYQDDNTEEAELHYQKGRLFEDEMDYPAATDAYERAVELNPQHAAALFRLGYWNDLRGEDETAIDYYEKAAECRPMYASVLINLGILYEDHGEYVKAAQLYDQVYESDRSNTKAGLYAGDARGSMNMQYDEILERRQSRTKQLLKTALSEFELSARSRSVLEKMNIRSLGDLARMTEEEIAQSKNFGETSLTELRVLLQSRGLHFGMGREGEAPVGVLAPPQHTGVMAKTIGELDFSVRCEKCMRTLGVKTLGDLVEKGERELLQCQNFGQTSLDEVEKKLAEHGLSLKLP